MRNPTRSRIVYLSTVLLIFSFLPQNGWSASTVPTGLLRKASIKFAEPRTIRTRTTSLATRIFKKLAKAAIRLTPSSRSKRYASP